MNRTRMLWFVLLLPPLALLLLLAQATLAHRPRPVRTGDALSDAYLQARADYSVRSDFTTTEFYAPMPEAAWRMLEQRFGSDPGYWLLRNQTGDWGLGDSSAVAQQEQPDQVSLLEQARARGCADWRILYALLADALDTAERQAAQGRAVQGGAAAQQAVGEKLLRELLQAGRDEAEPHYLAARLAVERDDWDTVLAELEAGNAAPKHGSPVGALHAVLGQALRQYQPLANDPLLSAQIQSEMALQVYDLLCPMSEGQREMIEKAAANADNPGRAGDLAPALYRYYERSLTAAWTDTLEQRIVLSSAQKLLKKTAPLVATLPPAQIQAIATAQQNLSTLRSALRKVGIGRNSSYPLWLSPTMYAIEGWPDRVLSGDQMEAPAALRASWDNACREQAQYDAAIATYMKQSPADKLFPPRTAH